MRFESAMATTMGESAFSEEGGGRGSPTADYQRLRQMVLADPVLSEALRFDATGIVRAQVDGVGLGFDLETEFSQVWDVGHAKGRVPGGMIIGERAWHASRALAPGLAGAVSDAASSLGANPLDLIDDNSMLIAADRIARAVHAVNFFLRGKSDLLFLPVHERLLKSVRYDHGRHFASVLISLGLNPARIVIEIPPAASSHKTFFAYLLNSYRSYGFKVAANLLDAGRILSMQSSAVPDFVIVDSRLTLRDALVKPLLCYGARTGLKLVFARVTDALALDRLRLSGVQLIETSAAKLTF